MDYHRPGYLKMNYSLIDLQTMIFYKQIYPSTIAPQNPTN